MPLFYKIYLSYYGTLLLACLLMGCLLVRRNWAPWYKLLVILACATFAVEGLAFITVMNGINHLPWYNVWVFLETATILLILSREVILPSLKRLHRILIWVLPVGAVVCFLLMPGFKRTNEYAMLFYLFEELIAACTVLLDLMRNVSDKPLFARPVFWLSTGMLFYCSLMIVIFSLGNFLDRVGYPYYIPFSCAANTFMYGGFIACFVTLRREDKRKIIDQC